MQPVGLQVDGGCCWAILLHLALLVKRDIQYNCFHCTAACIKLGQHQISVADRGCIHGCISPGSCTACKTQPAGFSHSTMRETNCTLIHCTLPHFHLILQHPHSPNSLIPSRPCAGASATVWPTTVATLPSATANTCAHAHGMADGREQGLAGAMETFCLSSSQPEHKSSHSSGSVLQQQNSRRCFAVVPPWAVHVPLKGGATGSRSGVAS